MFTENNYIQLNHIYPGKLKREDSWFKPSC